MRFWALLWLAASLYHSNPTIGISAGGAAAPSSVAPKIQSPFSPRTAGQQPTSSQNPPQPGGQGQLTPPIQPQTPLAKLPPPVDVPPPPEADPRVPNRPLSAEEAAQIALRNQPAVATALGNLVQARGQVVQQRASLYPSITFSQSYLRSDTFVAATPSQGSSGGGATPTAGGTSVRSQGFSGGVSLTQLLFDFNRTRDLVQQQEALEQAAQHGYTKAQIDTILAAKQAFYTLVQDQGLVQVNEANVQAAQTALDQAQAALNAGLGAPADVVSARTNLANSMQTLLQVRATAVDARVALALEMGVDPRTPISTASSSEPAEPNLLANQLVDEAMRDRPDIRQAIEEVRASGFAVSAARASNAPQLDLQLNVLNSGPRNPLANQSVNASLNVTWNFDDGGLAAGRTESANGEAMIAKANLQAVTQGAISDVSQSYENVKTAEQRVDIANVQVQNATDNLNLAMGQYRAGVTPFVTVINAQSELAVARADQVNANAALAQARAALNHALGH